MSRGYEDSTKRSLGGGKERPDGQKLQLEGVPGSQLNGMRPFDSGAAFLEQRHGLISRNSSSINSWSGCKLRRLDKTWRASALRPWWINHLGLKGMKSNPTPRATPGMS